MFEEATEALTSLSEHYAWLGELAGILPLSALIDFIDVPMKLHVYQLAGYVPLWSWPVTPAGSRFLLSAESRQESASFDRFGHSMHVIPQALDGRYGDRYFISSPETLRLALESQHVVIVENDHENMLNAAGKMQNLDLIFISRAEGGLAKRRSLLLSALSVRFVATSVLGWVLLCACIVATAIFRLYVATAFLLLMPVTGAVVHVIYGDYPRLLYGDSRSSFKRMCIATEHAHSVNWTVFHGESTLVNSLLNRPLSPAGRGRATLTGLSLRLAQLVLRGVILGQWALAIGAAATKGWDSFFICFWIFFCNAAHAYLIPPAVLVGDWARRCAGIELRRYRTKLSSPRAALNTLVTLNPDTFIITGETTNGKGRELCRLGLSWVDTFLKPSHSRTIWENATRDALNEVAGRDPAELASGEFRRADPSPLSVQWNNDYSGRDCYWKPSIVEGIYMAAKIRQAAHLSGHSRDESSCSWYVLP